MLLFLLIAVSCLSFDSYSFLKSPYSDTRRRLYFSLFGTVVSPSDELITPTIYEKDLYAILGVSKDSTKAEIKQAYLSIVFNNHPDRNNSEEAIHIFRNASYAYQILGKDEKMRASYDRKIDTQAAITVLEEVGNDILKPLAMEVAVPLLNLTMRSIGSFAIPFLRDVFEQSAAVAKAAIADDEANDSFEDAFTRAVSAFEKTSYNQHVRRLNSDLAKLNESLTYSIAQLSVVEKTEAEANSKVTALEMKRKADQASLDRIAL